MTHYQSKSSARINSDAHNIHQKKGGIRLFDESDLEVVADMSKELIPLSSLLTNEQRISKLRQLYLENEFHVNGTASLVYEDENGGVIGFLGVTEQPMLCNGRTIIAANSSQMMVRTQKNAALASVQLLKTLMNANYDLCFADSATDLARLLWQRCGGTTAELFSLYYRQMLQPHKVFRNHLCGNALHKAVTPLCFVADTVLNYAPGSPFRFKKTGIEIQELETEELLALMQKTSGSLNITPVYTNDTLQWRIKLLKDERRYGPFKAVKMVKQSSGDIAGWALFHLKKGGVCEIIQLETRPGMESLIFETLCNYLWQQGGAELVGRLDPRHFGKIGFKTTLFMPGFRWMLVYSANAEILNSIKTGEAYLSRLEGDLRLV